MMARNFFEPVRIYGRKESGEGFHFFKALGEILKKKLKDRPWVDFFIVNIGEIKRQVDAQLSWDFLILSPRPFS